ncbi:MAG: hypothetical protein M0Z84_12815 [Gammaproteobacteria bacterium]|nr:hypothetical protein [Gammaproteobacteria bacterium]
MKPSVKLPVIALAVLLGGLSASAFATTAFERNHPRRDQVNDRLQTQNRRIHREVREGEMGHRQAMRLHRRDRRIRRQERRFARHHHGTISRAEQARLNRRENIVSHRIGR